MKTCTSCSEAKPVDQFYPYKRSKDGLRHWCKDCASTSGARWRESNLEKRRTRERAYYEANKRDVLARSWRNKLRVQYGLTLQDYDAMLCAQSGRCAICNRAFGMGHADLPHVDHDHITGRIRGLLCPDCNHGIGCFRDDKAVLAAAISYLA